MRYLNLSSLRRASRPIVFGLFLAMAPMITSCYGRFPLTHAVYHFNGDVTDNKWVHSLLMWGLIIIPVYKIAMIGDILIFNLIEFWTGDTLHIGFESEEDGTTVTLNTSDDGTEAILTVSKEGKIIGQQRFVHVAEGKLEIRDAQGRKTGLVVQDPRGGFEILDENGRSIGVIDPETVSASKFLRTNNAI